MHACKAGLSATRFNEAGLGLRLELGLGLGLGIGFRLGLRRELISTHTCMHARQGCQPRGLMRLGGTCVDSVRIVK